METIKTYKTQLKLYRKNTALNTYIRKGSLKSMTSLLIFKSLSLKARNKINCHQNKEERKYKD